MKIRMLSIVALISMWLISACGGTSGDQQTLQAINAEGATAFFNVAASATVQMDRMQVTVEFMERESLRAEDARNSLIATLEERGIPINLAGVNLATPSLVPSTTPNAPTNPNAPISTEEVSPFTPTPTASIVGLTSLIMSTGVQQDNCPLNNTAQFSPSTPEIYITAVANSLPAGTLLASRWIRNNEELVVYDRTTESAIEQACIWFFVDQTDFLFENGVYSVILEVNGTREGEVTFTIAGDQ